VLEQLGYDRDPAKLQLIIRALFEAIEAHGLAVPGLPSGTVCLHPWAPADKLLY
jgi:hypothetical protein